MCLYTSNARFGCFLLAGVMALSGCATSGAPDLISESRNSIFSVSVSVGDFAPDGVSSTDANPEKSATTGTIVGAAPGAVGMAAIAPACANPYTAGVCAVFLPIFGVMTVAGGGAGATYGESAGSMKAQAQRALKKTISEDVAQRSLITKVIEYGTSTASRSFNQAAKGTDDKLPVDAHLEVGLLKADSIEMQGGYWRIVSTHYAVSLEARAKLKRRSDGVVMADRTYRYVSVPRTPQEWSSNEGRQLIDEIDNGYRQLAEWAVDDFFLSYPEPKMPLGAAKAEENWVFGHVASSEPIEFSPPVMPFPVEPVVNFCKPIVISGIPFPPILLFDLLAVAGQAATKKPCDTSTPYITVASLTPVKVDSLRPNLRWSFDIDSLRRGLYETRSDSFRQQSLSGPVHSSVGTVSKIRYEVRVFLAEEIPSFLAGKKKELRAIKPVYEKSGLVDSFHVLEKSLAPCSHYLWTARALFEQEGVTHSTEWAGNYWSVFEGNFDPAKLRKSSPNERLMLMKGKPFDYAFPFSTPCEGKDN